MIIMMASSMTGLVAVAVIHQKSAWFQSPRLISNLYSFSVGYVHGGFQRSPCRVLGNQCVQSMPFKVTGQTLANGSSSYMLVNC